MWFRESCRNQAEMLDVRGWVANRSDGSVEADIDGTPDAVDALIAWMRVGPPRATVTTVEVTESPHHGDWAGFRVLSRPAP